MIIKYHKLFNKHILEIVEFIKRDGLIKEKISKNEALNKIKEILLWENIYFHTPF